MVQPHGGPPRRRCASRSAQFNDSIDAIERALFEVQYEEEQLSYEWEIEREIDEKPRTALLPWSYHVEDQKRFRKSSAMPGVAVHRAAQRARYAGHAAAADRSTARRSRSVSRLLMEERRSRRRRR